jgi:hypothetical protein
VILTQSFYGFLKGFALNDAYRDRALTVIVGQSGAESSVFCFGKVPPGDQATAHTRDISSPRNSLIVVRQHYNVESYVLYFHNVTAVIENVQFISNSCESPSTEFTKLQRPRKLY